MKAIIVFLLTALIIANADSSKNIKDSFKRKVSIRMMEGTTNSDSSSIESSNSNTEGSSEKSDETKTNSDSSNDSSSVESSNASDGTETNSDSNNDSSSEESSGLSEEINNTENNGTGETNGIENITEAGINNTNSTNELSDNTTNTTDELPDNTTNTTDETNITETSDEANNRTNGSEITESSNEEQPIENPISIEEADKKANIKLSFRQIQAFNFNKEAHSISFTFFGIASQPIQTGYSFTFRLYLIFIDGTKDTELSEATCTYEKDQYSDGLQTQVEFNCIIKDLDENQEYSSFEIFDSEFVAGIPDDKILLDPVKTQKAIDDGLLDDYSLEENQHKYPLFFRTEILDGTVSETGVFKIIGTISDEVKEDIHFNLDLTYPANQITKCKLPVSPAGRVEIECVFKKSISDYIVIELQIIRQGLKELFTMASLKSSSPYQWENPDEPPQETPTNIPHPSDKTIDDSIPVEIQKKLNLNLSFRQVNGFSFNPSAHIITFYFFGITTQKIFKGYEFYFELYLILEDGAKDAELTKALCTLDKDVDPANKQAQTDFSCSISNLNENQNYQSFEIYASEEIAGIPTDKTLLDPIKTAQAIRDGKLLDYSLEENKEKLPIFFKTESIVGNYTEKGQFKILGSVEEKIEEDMEFTIELLYPEKEMATCKLLKSDPGQVEIICTLQNVFYGEFVMIEQQILRCELLEITLTSLKSSEKLDWIKDAEEETGEISSQIPDKDKNGTNESDISPSDEAKEFDSAGATSYETNESDKEELPSNETNESDKNEIPPNMTDEQVEPEKPTNNTSEEITFEEAEKRANITISFRQINNFQYNSGTITFYLYVLITAELEQNTEITLLVNLIDKTTGEREDNITKSICKLENSVKPAEGESAQGDFKCTIEGLTKEYYSLRLNSSDDITGIPDDEILLDPVLTKEAIDKNELLDYSIEENKSPTKIPATFIPESIEKASCDKDGIFKIKGSLSKEISKELSFKIPLTFPDGITADCSLKTKENEISCQVDRAFDDLNLVFEQNIIKDGSEEILNIGGISSAETITCMNGFLTEVEKKVNVKISFRQVSHLTFNGKDGFSFFFIAFSSEDISAKSTLTIKITVLIKGEKNEKEVQCVLRDDVKVSGGKPSQAIFDCDGKVEEEEYKGIEIDNEDSIKFSTNNENIGGIYDVDGGLSPMATDKAIKETKERLENNETLTDLAECIDYSEEEIIPPTLDITSIGSLVQCPNGKLTLRGKFSSKIEEETVFDLPLSYPQLEIKCKVDQANENEEVDISCKTQKKFKLVEKFVIEPRLVKKKHKEVVHISGKPLPIVGNPAACEDYNMVKYMFAKRRQKADFSFLQLSHFRPVGPKANFFMAMRRTRPEVGFQQIKITIIVRIQIVVNALRQLDDAVKLEPLDVTCAPKADVKSNEASGFDCNTDKDASNAIKSMELDPSNEVGGLPEETDPTKLPTVDYSDPNNLKIIDNLSKLTINDDGVDGQFCQTNGTYFIRGTLDKEGLKDINNVEIPFASPDSSGLCNIKVNGKDVTMECQNKEKFTTSQILFEQSTIKDINDNPLFILDSYTNLKSFACDISEKSVLPKDDTKNNTDKTKDNDNNNNNNGGENNGNNSEKYHKYYKESSSGLKGGAIAAIIISIVAALAIVTGILLYFKGKTKPPVQAINNSSTFDKINVAPNPNDF